MIVNKSCKKFKGEIENYLGKSQNHFDSKIQEVFLSLKVKTWLCRTDIVKQDGYHALHILLVLIMIPFLDVKTVHTFCQKQWQIWSLCKKDMFYRFKNNAKYRWCLFMRKINIEIFKLLELKKNATAGNIFLVDDSNLVKTGRKIENISYVHDHHLNQRLHGYCIVALGLLIPKGFYNLDFAYWFGKERYRKSPEETLEPLAVPAEKEVMKSTILTNLNMF